MKRPDIAIKTLKACNIHSYHTQFMVEVSDWIDYLESRIQPVAVNETSTGDNAATQPRKTVKAECNGVTDDTKAVQAMLDKSQPRKTVSDAVDYFDGVWPKHAQDCEYMSWTGFNFAVTRVRVGNHVCTREEFKAEVERRKGEEWTHVHTTTGSKCKIICDKPDDTGHIAILVYGFGYDVAMIGDVRKRKPTISKAEVDAVKAWYAWLEDNDKSGLTSDLIEEYISEHEVK